MTSIDDPTQSTYAADPGIMGHPADPNPSPPNQAPFPAAGALAPAVGQLPFPPPSDWWRCFRIGPVSGRYRGLLMTATSSELECRVDIDPRSATSPVTDRISGDLYNVFVIKLPGRPPISWRIYRESWIVDAPQVAWARCSVTITGRLRWWTGTHPDTDIRVVISWGTFRPPGPAEVTFTEVTGTTQTYVCPRVSGNFRDLNLEVDVCRSVNAPPLLPSYDTHAHPNRPVGLPQHMLTVETAYRDAGVGVVMNVLARNEVDDSNPPFQSWSPSELHDAMESAFSQFSLAWPRWSMWGMLAGSFDNPGVAGIMFDAAAAFGGAGEAPERQGFTVFRNHPWFNSLPAGAPANDAEAAALRDFIYTYVHEAGHAFNFLHSWNKGRPLALSWMNYPWRYDNLTQSNQFWGQFEFQFDTEELIHMRHGNRAAVIMGGDPWSSGGHLEAPSAAFADLDGAAPLELLLRAEPPLFDLMERVTVDVRLRNRMDDLPLTVDTRLDPAFGGVAFYIRRPDGTIVHYSPIACQLAEPELRTLQPAQAADTGQDRHSAEVDLTYGSTGFLFDHAGEYQIRALYQGPGDLLIPSNVLRIRVLAPLSRETQLQTAEFFTNQVGLAIALGGSGSPHLEEGMRTLERIAQDHQGQPLGARAAEIIAATASAPFFRIEDPEQPEVVQVKDVEMDKATEFTELALNAYQQDAKPRLNLADHRLVRQHAVLLAEQDRPEQAKEELAALRERLQERGVRPAVLEEIKAFENRLGRRRKGRRR